MAKTRLKHVFKPGMKPGTSNAGAFKKGSGKDRDPRIKYPGPTRNGPVHLPHFLKPGPDPRRHMHDPGTAMPTPHRLTPLSDDDDASGKT